MVETIRRIEDYEGQRGLRSRARRAADRVSFEASVAAVVCSTIHHHLTGKAGGIAVPRDKRELARKSRYRPPAEGKALLGVLDALSSPEIGLVELVRGHPQTVAEDGRMSPARRTVVVPTALLQRRIAQAALSFADLTRDSREEIILLRSGKRIGRGGRRQGELIEYDDNELTRRLRSEVGAVNEALAAADIELVGSECRHIDTTASARRLHRVFNNGRFDHGGRYGGGWWLTLPKSLRRNMRINVSIR